MPEQMDRNKPQRISSLVKMRISFGLDPNQTKHEKKSKGMLY